MAEPIVLPDPALVICPACATANRVPLARLTADGACGKCWSALFAARPVVLTGANFDAHATRSDMPLLVDFWAGWCGPCRQMAPAFEAAAARLEPRMRLGKLDTEAEQALAARHAIRSIPTMILLHKGREIARQSGAMPVHAIVSWARHAGGLWQAPTLLSEEDTMTAATDQPAGPLKYEDWAGEMGARWLANLTGFENTIAPVGKALLARADYRAGERVVDIGFGGGATSLAIARAVGPAGAVLGIDISPDLVAATARRAAQAGLANARFLCADAATVEFEGEPYDRLCSRFGSMFFSEPVPAFSNLRRLLKPGARIDLAVWGPPPDNPWMTEGIAIARRHIDLPPPVPRAPGPFAFEEQDYLRETLTAAGFTAVDLAVATGHLAVGGAGATPEQACQFAVNAMAFGQLLADCPNAVQQAVGRELTELYARHHQPGRGVMMGYKVWLVTAGA